MSEYRDAIQRAIEGADLHGYTFEVFDERRRRAARRGRVAAMTLGVVVGAAVILATVFALRGTEHETPAIPTITVRTVSNLERHWSRDMGPSIKSTPILAGHRVFVTNTAGALLAFPKECPAAKRACLPIWTAHEPGSTFDIGSPAVAGDLVFVGTEQGTLYGYPTACAPGRCRPTWIAKPGGDLSTASPTVAGGVVYIGSTDGTLSAFATGCDSYPRPCRPRWAARLHGGFGEGGYAGAQPAVGDGVVYVGSTAGTLYVFPTACRVTCAPLRTVHLGGPMNNPLVVDGGTLYVTSDNHLYAFPTRCLDVPGPCDPSWVGRAPALIVSTPAIGGGNVYVGSDADAVSVFSQDCAGSGGTCAPAWTIPDLGRVPNPSYLNGVVFVGSTWSRNQLLAYDADCGASGATCTPLWSYLIPDFGSISQTVVSDGRTLYATTGDLMGASVAGGSLFAFRVEPTTP